MTAVAVVPHMPGRGAVTDEHHKPTYVLQRGQDDALHNPVPFRCCLAPLNSRKGIFVF